MREASQIRQTSTPWLSLRVDALRFELMEWHERKKLKWTMIFHDLARWLVLERCWRSAGYSHFCSGVHDRCSLCRLCSSIDVQPALFIGPRKQGRQVAWRNHTVRSVPMRLSDTCRTNDSRLDSDTRNERRITGAMLEIEMTDTFRPVRQRSQIWLQTCSIQMG